VLLALLLTAAISGTQARDPLRAIDDCLERLDSVLDIGYPRIAARCPELTPALRESAFAAWLPSDWSRADNALSAAGLTELRTLLAREAGRGAPPRAAPRAERVGPVLAALARSDAAGGNWWQRFKDWLREILTPSAEADNGWLRRWLAGLNLSGQTAALIAWGTFALTVALAAAIVVSELRVAGFLGAGARRARAVESQRGARAGPTLEAIERATPTEQPALLLELIARRLVEQSRLPPARALTVRELGRRARLPDESARGCLLELVTVCERLRFSAGTVAAATLGSALRSGRSLLATLDARATEALGAH